MRTARPPHVACQLARPINPSAIFRQRSRQICSCGTRTLASDVIAKCEAQSGGLRPGCGRAGRRQFRTGGPDHNILDAVLQLHGVATFNSAKAGEELRRGDHGALAGTDQWKEVLFHPALRNPIAALVNCCRSAEWTLPSILRILTAVTGECRLLAGSGHSAFATYLAASVA